MATMKELAALLGVELGEEFRISDSRWLFKFDDNGLMHKTEDEWRPFETISTLCGLFTGKREVVKLPWKPEHKERYFRIGGSSVKEVGIFYDRFDDVIEDYINYATGNCFRTKEEAEAHIEEVITRLKAIYENGREEQKAEKPSVEEAVKALKGYCKGHACDQCKFCVDKENGEGCRLKNIPSIWPI